MNKVTFVRVDNDTWVDPGDISLIRADHMVVYTRDDMKTYNVVIVLKNGKEAYVYDTTVDAVVNAIFSQKNGYLKE